VITAARAKRLSAIALGAAAARQYGAGGRFDALVELDELATARDLIAGTFGRHQDTILFGEPENGQQVETYLWRIGGAEVRLSWSRPIADVVDFQTARLARGLTDSLRATPGVCRMCERPFAEHEPGEIESHADELLKFGGQPPTPKQGA
jgi:hypothetical protein